jgi:hypothetical protein
LRRDRLGCGEEDGLAYVSPDTAVQAWRFGPPGSPMVRGIGSVVSPANPGDVKRVFVDGRPVKRDGVLVGVEISRARHLAEESRERVLSRVLAHGPLLPEATPNFAEQLDAFGKANIARAHELAHS